MKVLIVSALYHPLQVGGAERVAQWQAEGLLAHGHDCVVVTTRPGGGVQTFDVNGVKVVAIGLRNFYWPHGRKERSRLVKPLWHAVDRYNPLMARAVARVLDEERPDVVHTHSLTGFSCAVWRTAKARGLPLVHTLHDYALMCPKTAMFRDGASCQGQCGVCALYTAPSRRHSGLVDTVAGVSAFVLQRHLGAGYFGGARERRVVHNGLPPAQPVAQAERTPGGPLRLGFVGQLVPAKGIAQLVQLMRAWDASQCELVVAGRGTPAFEETLRRDAPPNVRFLGFVNPAEAVYGQVDALVVPSLWHEPLPLVVPEAAMHGVPAIVARRGGLPEMVDDGRTGFVFDPDDPQALMRVVDACVRDRATLAAMRPRVLARARDFTIRRMQADYVDLIARTLAAQPVADR